jgi:hypothetical protein
MLPADARYLMVGLSYHDDDSPSIWRGVPEHMQSYLLTGNRFGILMLKLVCDCGHVTSFNTFFLNNPDDYIVSSCMGMQNIEGDLHIHLPLCGCRGLYQMDDSVKRIDDACILRMLVRSQTSFSSNLVYQSIERNLLKKMTWKRIRRITAQMRCLKREKGANACVVALRVLTQWIPEPELRKQIVRAADLW